MKDYGLKYGGGAAFGPLVEPQLSLLFDAMSQGVLFMDRAGVIQHVNLAAERILGISRGDLLGRSALDQIFGPTDSGRVAFPHPENPGQLARESGETRRGVIVGIFNRVLQERRMLSVDYLPLRNLPEPAFSEVCAVFNDITEQKRTQNALRDSQIHLAAAQRVASVGSMYFDFRSEKIELSEQSCALYGIDVIDSEGFSPSMDALLDCIDPNDRSVWLEGIESAKRGADPYPLEYRICGPDGQSRTVYQEWKVSRDTGGDVTGTLATIRDVTELRQGEKDRAELQTQLYHAQRLEALGTLAGGIAHDLNNTLVPILGLSEAMLATLGPKAPNRTLIEIIHEAGIRARDLVRQVLAFSRRETVDSRPVQLSLFMRETMRLVRASVPTTIKVKQMLADVPPVFADASQLHQVIVNLVTNAVHAIGDANGTITLRLAEWEDETLDNKSSSRRKFARISVIDSGCGMDEKTQQRIFEPFFSTKTVGHGTGLGLSVVHGIVAAHGGQIKISSKQGKGARFDVLLPLMEDEQQPLVLDDLAA